MIKLDLYTVYELIFCYRFDLLELRQRCAELGENR